MTLFAVLFVLLFLVAIVGGIAVLASVGAWGAAGLIALIAGGVLWRAMRARGAADTQLHDPHLNAFQQPLRPKDRRQSR